MQKKVEKAMEVEEVIAATKPFLSEDEHTIVAMQMRLAAGKKKHYPEEFKAFAIAIYYKSPSCYRFLRSRFRLPSKSTINLWLSKLQYKEGLCPNLMKLLEIRVKRLPEEERLCVLIADEISLKTSADYSASEDKVFGCTANGQILNSALVFMVGGLRSKWKQAFFYKFTKSAVSAEELWPILKEILSELKKIGLQVVLFSTDQGSNFSSLKSILGVSSSRPFFLYEGQKIFSIDDPPHLLKNLRNCLLKNEIHSSVGVAKWCYIADFYEQDKNQGNFRLAPKLTDGHLNLKAFGAKMKVKRAANVISKTVASGIFNYVHFGR